MVRDIDSRFYVSWALERRNLFRAQQLSQFLAKHDHEAYHTPVFTDAVKLAYGATYGHCRLLGKGLAGLTDAVVGDIPLLLSAQGVAKECGQLLLGHLPTRPVVVVGEYSEERVNEGETVLLSSSPINHSFLFWLVISMPVRSSGLALGSAKSRSVLRCRREGNVPG